MSGIREETSFQGAKAAVETAHMQNTVRKKLPRLLPGQPGLFLRPCPGGQFTVRTLYGVTAAVQDKFQQDSCEMANNGVALTELVGSCKLMRSEWMVLWLQFLNHWQIYSRRVS